MKKVDVVRAWKDAVYRASLSAAELAEVPENPAGLLQLSDDELKSVSGGTATHTWVGLNTLNAGCCLRE
jgi:mersacidin/lichenicidin family type 2 lantibiotic